MKSFYVGDCPICCGMLEIVISINGKNFSIMCDECSAEWENPEDALNNRGGSRASANEIEVRTATLDEIKIANWDIYIV